MIPRDVLEKPSLHKFDYLGLVAGRSLVRALLDEELGEAAGLHVLDVGCGASAWRGLLEPYADRITGLDVEPGDLVDIVAPAEAMPIEDATFDVLFSNAVLEHVRAPAPAVAEMHRVLKPGGLLLLGTHGTWTVHNEPYDFWRWTVYGLREQFKAFDPVRVEQVGSPWRNYFMIQNLYLRSLQVRFHHARILLTPWILLHNTLGSLGAVRSDRPATLPAFYYVAARKPA